jgi:dGTPase
MSNAASGIKMYSTEDTTRLYDYSLEKPNPLPDEKFDEEIYRSPFYRDYGRLIHSPSFRRLQGKSQLFPSNESDFFRNRLTHSIEVAQIAKAITNRLNWILSKEPKEFHSIKQYIDADLVQFAGLAHDLGHPPFGHQGEHELNNLMRYHGGFEGNAQTLRLLCKIEKKIKRETIEDDADDYGFDASGADKRMGLNLTARSLAAILKYDKLIPIHAKQANSEIHTENKDAEVIKGYYDTEKETVEEIKRLLSRNNGNVILKTVEMQIMDIADDIAYSIYDLEDSLKGNFISSLDLLVDSKSIFHKISQEVNDKLKEKVKIIIDAKDVQNILSGIFDVFSKQVKLLDLKFEDVVKLSETGELQKLAAGYAYGSSRNLANNGYYRTRLTSWLVGMFIRSVEIDKKSHENPAFWSVNISDSHRIVKHLKYHTAIIIEVLKKFTYKYQIESHKLKIVESRGRDIVNTIFKKLLSSDGKLFPKDYAHLYDAVSKIDDPRVRELQQYRITCDFVASMTDKYAVEFYGRLKSENPQSIFKSY